MSRPRASRSTSGPRASQRDSLDFRDWIYEPALIPLAEYVLPEKRWMHVLNQGEEGACTGFGLAALINLLIRKRGGSASERVSPRMLYEMARRHDRWPGHRHDGSSARGAVKGWYKNGVCLEDHWPYELNDPGELSDEARQNALEYLPGAFYRILPRRSDLHAALSEVGVVFATAATHKGWDEPEDGMIPHEPGWAEQGGHAFAIVGYTHEGLLIQNSWGEDWGGIDFERTSYPGCALWSMADFDRNVWDLWVARMARPVESVEALALSAERRSTYTSGKPPVTRGPPRASIRDHFIHLDDGQFDPHGDYWSTEGEARRIVREAVAGGRHILLYAHGGLNSVRGAARRVARWRPVFEANGIHELHFIWETGLLAELRDVLLGKQEFVEGRAGGFSDWADAWIERVTGPLGRGLWQEMLGDAEIAFREKAAGTKVLEFLLAELGALDDAARPSVHLAGHSAGAVFLGHLLDRCASVDPSWKLGNLILLAPACTHEFFTASLRPSIEARRVEALHHFLLHGEAELDDNVALVYRKSLLYLVSRAYQKRGEEVPILGMEKFPKKRLFEGIKTRVSQYTPASHPDLTGSTCHLGFDDDLKTMNTLLRLVTGAKPRRLFEAQHMGGGAD